VKALRPGLDRELVERVEAHSVTAWPPAVCEVAEGGWVLRATPGLARGRSNHALAPTRPLSRSEVLAGVARVEEFARQHGIPPGIQVSPLELHGRLLAELEQRGWSQQMSVLVMALAIPELAPDGPGLPLQVTSGADPAWLAAWAECEPGRDIPSHVRTVFPRLEGRARFVRHERLAVGISVESDDLAGLFCLAVAPAARRQGLGTALVRTVLHGCAARVAYLQVEASNATAIRMYERLGFHTVYRYQHCVAPE
jgi:GNAT superfamily N-acetyltransferase